ncbi:hypothetical protein PIB30_032317 [Stylosanthes scabra]|uniref:Uncharacterized protein n=1 Tax=Stylosanthes scabra TaxID=79078 RepID=A0ABU6QBW0_9FABA|nr:hypothetical protein [Stylosanthes scabra]
MVIRKETLVVVLFSYLFIITAFLAISTNGDNTFVKFPRPALTNKYVFQYGDEYSDNYDIQEVNKVAGDEVPKQQQRDIQKDENSLREKKKPNRAAKTKKPNQGNGLGAANAGAGKPLQPRPQPHPQPEPDRAAKKARKPTHDRVERASDQ